MWPVEYFPNGKYLNSLNCQNGMKLLLRLSLINSVTHLINLAHSYPKYQNSIEIIIHFSSLENHKNESNTTVSGTASI